MITKQQALDAFINDHVMGNRPFAYDLTDGMCKYSHSVGGGCAIGRFLPAALAENLDAKHAGSYLNAIITTGFREALEELMEDPRSQFWDFLQLAHDNMAQALCGGGGSPDLELSGSNRWLGFQNALRDAARYV